jgi:hypothetical protein
VPASGLRKEQDARKRACKMSRILPMRCTQGIMHNSSAVDFDSTGRGAAPLSPANSDKHFDTTFSDITQVSH